MGPADRWQMMTMAAIPLDNFITGSSAAAPSGPERKRADHSMKGPRAPSEKCTGCLRCELACSYMQTVSPAVQVGDPGLALRGYTSYAPYTCTQCAEGWCMDLVPVGGHPEQRVGARRGRRHVRGVQALYDRVSVRDHVLRRRHQKPTSANLCGAPGLRVRVPDRGITSRKRRTPTDRDFARSARAVLRWRAADAGPVT